MTLTSLLFKALKAVLQPWWRLTRGQTLGVRAIVFNDAGDVLLVRHRYAAGWHFPGGGVEPGETVEQAVMRELAEEAGITAIGRPRLFALYANFPHFPRDHVAVCLIEKWARGEGLRAQSLEIADARFFPRDELPGTTLEGVRRRLAELKSGAQPDAMW